MSDRVYPDDLAEARAFIAKMEQDEQDKGPDGFDMDGYGYTWLLAYYFLRADPTKALNIWNRVPKAMRDGHPEFLAVWTVGNRLLEKDMAGFYQACGAYQWTRLISRVILKLKEAVRKSNILLLDTEYGAIGAKDLGTLLGLSGTEVKELVREQTGWEFKWGWGGWGRMVKLNGAGEEKKPTYYYQYKYTEEDFVVLALNNLLILVLVGFLIYNTLWGSGAVCKCVCKC